MRERIFLGCQYGQRQIVNKQKRSKKRTVIHIDIQNHMKYHTHGCGNDTYKYTLSFRCTVACITHCKCPYKEDNIDHKEKIGIIAKRAVRCFIQIIIVKPIDKMRPLRCVQKRSTYYNRKIIQYPSLLHEFRHIHDAQHYDRMEQVDSGRKNDPCSGKISYLSGPSFNCPEQRLKEYEDYHYTGYIYSPLFQVDIGFKHYP